MGARRAEIQERTNKEREGVRESERNKSDQILVVYARARITEQMGGGKKK